jgi:hypothetical protein
MLRRALELVLESGRKHPDDILNELRLSGEWIGAFCGLPLGKFKGSTPPAPEPTLK